MGGLLRHASPTGVPSKGGKVGFAESLVTGVSRPVNNEEHWILYYFESHATQCKSCINPLKVAKSGKQLCDEGHRLAIDVADLIFRRSDGEVYSRTRDNEQEVRVEIPLDYEQILSLLKAIQRAIKKGEHFLKKPKSHDRTYFVASRTPAEHKAKPDTHDHRTREDVNTSPRTSYDTILVEPSSPTPRPRRRERSPLRNPDSSKRGSLYGMDIADLERAERQEQRLRYNLEVREPTKPSHSRSHRHHGPLFA